MPGPGSYLIGDEEIREVLDVLQSGRLSRYGNFEDPKFKHKVVTLEKEFARYLGVTYTLATNSGTGALMCCLAALGLKPGDEVLVPSYTFLATYSAAIFLGIVPVLCEIDESLTMDPTDLKRRLTPRTRAIMPVHMLGNLCAMDPIMAFAKQHGLFVIEDACQAAGAVYKGRKAGSIGHMAAFSFNIYKTITAGDGGLVAASSEEYYKLAFGLHDQGHSPLRAGLEIGKRSILGLNFRMNELTGAVALAQLRKLDKITSVLREKKNQLAGLIQDIPGMRFRQLNDAQGECGTLLTVIFDDPNRAARVADKLGTKTVDQSGWHVYSNMEHVNHYLKRVGQPHGKGAYPRTDEILSRSINISIGVVDAGLGAGFGVNIRSTPAEIETVARQFRRACAVPKARKAQAIWASASSSAKPPAGARAE